MINFSQSLYKDLRRYAIVHERYGGAIGFKTTWKKTKDVLIIGRDYGTYMSVRKSVGQKVTLSVCSGV